MKISFWIAVYAATQLKFLGASAQRGQVDGKLFNLKESVYNTAISRLDGVLTKKALSEVIGEAKFLTATATNDLADAIWYKDGFRWSLQGPDDISDGDWEPEGITTAADSGYEGKGAHNGTDIIVSWVSTTKQGIRVSLVGPEVKTGSGLAKRKYIHALLVQPYVDKDGKPNFKSFDAFRAGAGIVWRGDNLFVADESVGLRVFDLAHIYEVSTGETVGRDSKSGTYYGGSTSYVIPQSRTYSTMWNNNVSFRMHSLSLDRNSTPPSLAVSEVRPEDNNETPTYTTTVVWWQFDSTTNLLKTILSSVGASETKSNVSTATWGWKTNFKNMGGIVFVSSGKVDNMIVVTNGGTANPEKLSDIYKWPPGAFSTEYREVLPPNARNLAYRPETQEVLVVGGVPGKRYVMSLEVDRKAGSNTDSEKSTSSDEPSATPTVDEAVAQKQNKLSGGAIAGIAIGVVLVVAGAIVAGLLVRRRKNRRNARPKSSEWLSKAELDSDGTSQKKLAEVNELAAAGGVQSAYAVHSAGEHSAGYHSVHSPVSPVSPSQELDSKPIVAELYGDSRHAHV